MGNLDKVENSSVQINEMVDLIIGDNLKEIDDYMEKVKTVFIDNQEILDGDLDKIILRIPVYIYNLVVIAQQIEMKKGLSKEHAKYSQNEAMLNSTGTVAEKQAKAENASVDDRLTMLAYTNAASIVSNKIDRAMTILDSAKKVQARKLAELKLTGQASNAIGQF